MFEIMETIGEANLAAILGLLGGIVLGLAARIGRFCTLGAIEDALYSSDNRRIRMWGIAIGVSIMLTHIFAQMGHFEFEQSTYLSQSWNPLAIIIGGLMFGYGMALCGNCGYGALARLGGGDLRSFVIVVVMGLSAFFVMSGPLAGLRLWLFPVEGAAKSPQSFSLAIEQWAGISPIISGIIIGAVFIAFSLASRSMLKSKGDIFWAIAIGFTISFAWVSTYWISNFGFEALPVEGHAFAEPIGETILYSMTASGGALSFSIGSVTGVWLGALLSSFSKGMFRWEACDDPRELRRQIFGAGLMGAGSILAVGCSIGQGLSAFALLTFSAPLALICIFIGAAFGLKQLIEGF